MAVILAQNNYGKSRVRMVKVARHGDRHDLQDITVNIACEGDFETAHTVGDNSRILSTDTMKNTVYALAKQVSDLEEIEAFDSVRLVAFTNIKYCPTISILKFPQPPNTD